jgi:hypothetical protein
MSGTNPTLDAALGYIAKGWAPVPIPHKQKGPRGKSWPTLRLTAESAPGYFNGHNRNVGLILGEASAGLADVDLDCDEARALANTFLPPTDAVFGRAGSACAHWLYVAPGLVTRQFADHGEMLVELRANVHKEEGAIQTMVPPSTHPCGEAVEWQDYGDPAAIDPAVLARAVAELAAAVLLLRHWPAVKGNHLAMMALVGWLTRAGWPEPGIRRFVGAIARAGAPDRDRAAAVPEEVRRLVEDAAGRHAKGEALQGLSTMVELFGEPPVKLATKWLALPVATSAASPGPWPDPEPLPEGLPPVAPFDPFLLPAVVRPWVCDIAERMQCPADYVAVAAMVALATVAGRQVAIRPKRQDDWTVVPNLWGAVVGRPGVLKSPALAEALRPLHVLEGSARDEHEEAARRHEAEKLVTKARAKTLDKAIEAAVKRGDDTDAMNLAMAATEGDDDAPVRRRYVTNDTTVEKLGEILAGNPRGVLIFRDELVGFLASLEREGREGSRAFFLEAWNGTSSFTFDRIGRGTIDIPAACVSILGGIQPGPLVEYLAGALRGGGGDDGLLQRYQLLVWPDAPRDWRNVDRWPDTPARSAVRELFARLDHLDPARIGATVEDGAMPFLRFDPAAQSIFDDWRSALERRLRADQDHPAFEAHLSKYRSLMPSLALLSHLADGEACGPVPEAAALRAIAWCDYLETHARRLYSPALDPALAAARELDKHILAGDLPDPFTARDVSQRGWRLLDRERTMAALAYLEDLDRVRGVPVQTGGRPTIRFSVNPKLAGGAP